MTILKIGYIGIYINKNCICNILKKTNGNNIMSFSKYVDEIIETNQLNNIINQFKPFCCCSSNDVYNEIIDIKNHLYKYNVYTNFFEKNFEKAKEENIFEFSIISLVIIERKDFYTFERERAKCPNRIDKILYHGSQVASRPDVQICGSMFLSINKTIVSFLIIFLSSSINFFPFKLFPIFDIKIILLYFFLFISFKAFDVVSHR